MKLKLIIPVIIMTIFTSCTQVVLSAADEVRLNTWTTELDNGYSVKLSFDEDTAIFKMKNTEADEATVIKGLCVFDEMRFLIYNQNENEPYVFDYKIKNNTLILKYEENSLVLTR